MFKGTKGVIRDTKGAKGIEGYTMKCFFWCVPLELTLKHSLIIVRHNFLA